MLKKIFRVYGAGSFGAVCNFFSGLVLAKTGVLAALSIHLPPAQIPQNLYQRVIWGGIWGGILLLPLPKNKTVFHGFLLGLFPAMAAGLFFFPQKGAGMFGTHFGSGMPVFIIVLNWIWGSTTLWAYRKA